MSILKRCGGHFTEFATCCNSTPAGDRQVAGLVALENPARVDAGQTVRVRKTASVAHQSAGSDELATLRRDRRHRMAEGQRTELFTPGSEE